MVPRMIVSINGVSQDPATASVPVFDRGFLFGDAIYEVVRTYGRRLFHLDAHLDRLARSGAAIGIDVGPLREPLVAEIDRLIAAVPPDGRDLAVRIMVTRGDSPTLELHHDGGPPRWLVWVRAIDAADPRKQRPGMKLASVRPDEVVGRVAPGVKSNNRGANVMAIHLARSRGADDALFVDPQGAITEGPTWNVFCVREGAVLTPALERGLLAGITRGLVLEVCQQLGVPAREATITLEEAARSDEMFLTSTTRGIVPIAELDGAGFAASSPGPMTLRLREAFEALHR